MSSKYQDLAQQFLYAISGISNAANDLIKNAGEIESALDSHERNDVRLANAVTDFNVGRQRWGQAMKDAVAAAKELDKYFAHGDGAGQPI